jgi:hypothetical protein
MPNRITFDKQYPDTTIPQFSNAHIRRITHFEYIAVHDYIIRKSKLMEKWIKYFLTVNLDKDTPIPSEANVCALAVDLMNLENMIEEYLFEKEQYGLMEVYLNKNKQRKKAR